MLRDLLFDRESRETHGFRWRSREISRIEGLSDAVFGFAITLLVVSLEVPRDFTELANRMRGFLAFAISFAMLVWIWYEQHRFFRRYALQDNTTIVLNVTLLFVVLFYVYPLKFLFGVLVMMYTGNAVGMRMADGGWALGTRRLTGEVEPILRVDQWPELMSIYAVGFIAIWTVFALLIVHAYRRREALALNDLETFDTRTKMRQYFILIAVGVASLVLAQIPGWGVPVSGWVYALIGPIFGVHSYVSATRRERLVTQQREGEQSAAAGPEPVTTEAPVSAPVVR